MEETPKSNVESTPRRKLGLRKQPDREFNPDEFLNSLPAKDGFRDSQFLIKDGWGPRLAEDWAEMAQNYRLMRRLKKARLGKQVFTRMRKQGELDYLYLHLREDDGPWDFE